MIVFILVVITALAVTAVVRMSLDAIRAAKGAKVYARTRAPSSTEDVISAMLIAVGPPSGTSAYEAETDIMWWYLPSGAAVSAMRVSATNPFGTVMLWNPGGLRTEFSTLGTTDMWDGTVDQVLAFVAKNSA
jgi:hypothetical protein